MEVTVRSPWSLTAADAADVAIVIDVLRATTTAAFLCERGADLLVLESPADLASLEHPDDYTIFSEMALPDGWRQLDNSPALARTSTWSGAPVLVTTNGTRAVHAALRVAGTVVFAGFVNIGAVAAWIRQQAPARVLLVPAGFEPRREERHEDSACARALEDLLAGRSSAAALADAAQSCRGDARVMGRLERNPGLRADVDLALAVDQLACVPLALVRGERVFVTRAR